LDRIGGRTGHTAIFQYGIEAANDSIQKEKNLAYTSAGFIDAIKQKCLKSFIPAVFGWAHARVAMPLI